MEIAIIKRETTGSGPNSYSESETVAKYEIMDGAPVRGYYFYGFKIFNMREFCFTSNLKDNYFYFYMQMACHINMFSLHIHYVYGYVSILNIYKNIIN